MKKTTACSLVGHLLIYRLFCLARHIENVDALTVRRWTRHWLDVADDYTLLFWTWTLVLYILLAFSQ